MGEGDITRACRACLQTKPLNQFPRYRARGRSYFRRVCRKCITTQHRNARAGRPTPNVKICRKCRKYQTRSAFSEHNWSKDNKRTCLNCSTQVKGSRYIVPGKLYPCRECKVDLPADAFYRKRNSSGIVSVTPYCRVCEMRKRGYSGAGVGQRRAKTRRDVLYDYGFAINALSMSKQQALEWIADGYPEEITMDVLISWGLPDLATIEWKVDDLQAV